MSTTVSLPPIAPASKQPNPAHELAAAFEITEGRILKVMCTGWDNDRASYRISTEVGGRITVHHRTYDNRQTTTINDLLWALASGRWACRPVYQGAGFICFHPDYPSYIARESPSL